MAGSEQGSHRKIRRVGDDFSGNRARLRRTAAPGEWPAPHFSRNAVRVAMRRGRRKARRRRDARTRHKPCAAAAGAGAARGPHDERNERKESDMSEATNEIATLGGGCFWCQEAVFLDVNGVTAVESGYAGGHTRNPGYRDVRVRRPRRDDRNRACRRARRVRRARSRDHQALGRARAAAGTLGEDSNRIQTTEESDAPNAAQTRAFAGAAHSRAADDSGAARFGPAPRFLRNDAEIGYRPRPPFIPDAEPSAGNPPPFARAFLHSIGRVTVKSDG